MTLTFMLLLDLLSPLLVIPLGVVLFLFFLVALFSRFLYKASPGEALVKTGFGLAQPSISMSSAFVIPLLHKAERIDLTVKTVRIERRGKDSLSCADGIRAEVEVDFYIKINAIDEDIRRVAVSVGCMRATSTEKLRELFEAKFADALKTAGSKLNFDNLYQNRSMFRDEILRALGMENEGEVILNGYRLDDVAIQYLEQLPLTMHDENNVLDAKGRKEIAMRTSTEAELANKRLREREVTIAEQDREAKTRQLQITLDIKEKEAKQEREIQEVQSREQAQARQTLAEQERLSREAEIQKEKALRVAEELKQQEIQSVQVKREKAIQISEQERDREIEIARIQREIAQTEALKEKIRIQEETARREAEKIRAEEEAQTVRALEIASRQRQIEVIQAEKDAAVEREKRKVESDLKAYELTTVSRARLDAAEVDAQAAELQSKAIRTVGEAEATALKARLEAENMIGANALLNSSLEKLIPQLPELVHQLMLPAEKIESIKILNVNGMDANGNASSSASPAASLIQTLLQMGMAMPVLQELLKTLKTQGGSELAEQLRAFPGGEQVLKLLENGKEAKLS